jgi:hypothetical protein
MLATRAEGRLSQDWSCLFVTEVEIFTDMSAGADADAAGAMSLRV